MDRIIILVGLLIVIIVGRVNRRAGGVLGILFTAGLTYWGLRIIKSGGQLYFLKFHLTQNVFLIIMGAFLIYNLIIAILPNKRADD